MSTKHNAWKWDIRKAPSCSYLENELGESLFEVTPEHLPNKRVRDLIAAAPDMLEALKMMQDLQYNELIDFNEYGLTCDADILKKLRAVIAKAEGRKS